MRNPMSFPFISTCVQGTRIKFSRVGGALSGMVLGGAALLATTVHAHAAASAPNVENGRYLARAADCEVCHTAEGGTPYAGGRAFSLPGVGVMYAPNITPDKTAGIGAWTDQQFVDAVRKGISPHWKHLYPAMPYPAYARMSDAEVRDIRAYLATLPPSAQKTPENSVKFPFSIRSLMVFWNMLNGPAASYANDPAKPADWNRGRYLVEGPGHCADCHSPRTRTFGLDSSRALGGNVVNGWRAYNLTPDKQSGLGAWSDEALAQYLSTGHADGHGTAAGDMADVIGHSLRYLSASDIHAMVVYLRSIAPLHTAEDTVEARTPTAGDASLPQNTRGARLYASACAGCHMPDGTGRQSSFGTITGARSLGADNGRNLVQLLVQGSGMQTTTGVQIMPHFAGGGLSERDLADIASFVMTHFTTATPHNMEQAVHDARQAD
ncbi:c-type cytochrome [Acetobacter fabarum]|uniref:c-type cytochrome n=1 Tax=Acetobacter fabarum TaxID=483199 RepID=UPI0039E791F3